VSATLPPGGAGDALDQPMELDERIARAQSRLFAGPLYFAPIRHHSPACAQALTHMLREVRPQRILIEGPESFDTLLPLLLDPQTEPPIAVLCASADAGGNSGHSYYPLCDYSPEWVALRLGHELGAEIRFIDLTHRAVDGDEQRQAHSLLLERHLAHSEFLRRLAINAGCRDHDELWDHLFELRSPAELEDWRSLFGEVHAYCAHARLDYSEAELKAEGSGPREANMLMHILRAQAECAGPILVLTGGFHTLGLIESLNGASSAASKRRGKPNTDPGWLIRYSFDRLDALNGYASGMPAPGWYQRVWEATQAGDRQPQSSAALAALTSFAQAQRGRGVGEGLSTADLQAALLQAERLAELRGHPGPGRCDLIDAAVSCFIKGAIDEGGHHLLGALRVHLSGFAMGNVPASAGSPPLLEQARSEARALGLNLTDAAPRDSHLDIYRKPRHLARSRYFQRMAFLGVRLGEWQGGPDFCSGTGLNLLIEHWRYAWTPTVEAQLIELASGGSSLLQVATGRLLEHEQQLNEQGRGRSTLQAVNLLTRACVIGLHPSLPRLLAMVERHLAEDASFGSVVGCVSQLLNLSRGRRILGLCDRPEPQQLLHQAFAATLLLLPGLANANDEQEVQLIAALVQLRPCAQTLVATDAELGAALSPLLLALAQGSSAAGIAGAAAAWLYLDQGISEAALADEIQRHFGVGADPPLAVRFLSGLLQLAPELLVHSQTLQLAMDSCLQRWDEDQFLRYLPELRRSLTYLKPVETEELAQHVAERYGLRDSPMQTFEELSEADVVVGTALEAALARSLRDSGLASWLQNPMIDSFAADRVDD